MNIVPAQVLTQIAGFLLLLGLLRRYAWGPILKALDDRKAKIASDLSEIETAKRDAAQMKADYEARMQEIDKQARLRMQEAIAEGNRHAHDITSRARSEADNILVKAKETIQSEMASAKLQMRNEVVDLAVKTAEKVMRCEFSEQRNKDLALQYLETLQ